MNQHVPDKLPPLVVELPADAYGYEATYIRNERPTTPSMAAEALYMCQVGIERKSTRIENAYPAHIGGVEQFFALRALAKRNGVDLQFSSSGENTV